MRLDHVQVAAPPGCEAEARRFYGELLGLAEVEKPERAARGAAAPGSSSSTSASRRPFAPARKAHPALRVDAGELDALAARLAAAGARRVGRRDPGRAPLLHVRSVGQPRRAAGLSGAC